MGCGVADIADIKNSYVTTPAMPQVSHVDTGILPLKGRPSFDWGDHPCLTLQPLLEQQGSILALHLTSQHLLIMHASPAANEAAAALWLTSNSLEPIHRLALPHDTCYAWAEYGLQQGLISTCSGAVYTMPIQPRVRLLLELWHDSVGALISQATVAKA